MDEIIELLGKVLAATLVALLSYASVTIIPRIKAWLNAKIGIERTEYIMKLIDSFVRSAQIQLKEDDPTGEKRKQYVVENLTALGYKLTEELNAQIESQVLNLKLEEKSVE